MIFQFTGQPGHGKTLHALELALQFKDKGRAVYVCNVRNFNHARAGMLPMTPDDFKDWMNFLPHGAVCLVDEAYEHGMIPKRPPSTPVPLHVQQLAKHRHTGIDFIFVCQSPMNQCDTFVRDLIDRHVHVRRKFGTNYVNYREFDKFQSNPNVAALTSKLVKLPTRPMGLYESTVLDTTERRMPFAMKVFIVLAVLAAGLAWYAIGRISDRYNGAKEGNEASTPPASNGALAKVDAGGVSPTLPLDKPLTEEEYIQQFTPRLPSQPWTAPIYDKLATPADAPRVFCMIGGTLDTGTCRCVTEQATRYNLELETCRRIAVHGQYEPYRDEKSDQLAAADRSTIRLASAEHQAEVSQAQTDFKRGKIDAEQLVNIAR